MSIRPRPLGRSLFMTAEWPGPEGSSVAETEFASVGEYIESFPADVGPVLEDVRRAVHGAVPGAGESISYGMAAITLDGTPLLYFAGWKRHVSLYPVPAGDAEFERRLEPYRSAKSTLKFLLSEPVPTDLIAEVARRHAEARAGS